MLIGPLYYDEIGFLFIISNIYHKIVKQQAFKPRGYFHIRRSGGLAPNFASGILVGVPNFAS